MMQLCRLPHALRSQRERDDGATLKIVPSTRKKETRLSSTQTGLCKLPRAPHRTSKMSKIVSELRVTCGGSLCCQRLHEVLRQHGGDLWHPVQANCLLHFLHQCCKSWRCSRWQFRVTCQGHLWIRDVLRAEVADNDLPFGFKQRLTVVDLLSRLPVELNAKLKHGPRRCTLDSQRAVTRCFHPEERQGGTLCAIQWQLHCLEQISQVRFGPLISIHFLPHHEEPC